MNRLYTIILFLMLSMLTRDQHVYAQIPTSDKIDTTLASQSQAVRLGLRIIAPESSSKHTELIELAQLVAKTLQVTGQFAVDVMPSEQPKTKNDITSLFAQGYGLVIFINYCPVVENENPSIEWRLYDTTNAHQMSSRKFFLVGPSCMGWAYNLADDMWFDLKQQRSSFASKIAYIKKKTNRFGSTQSVICVSNFDGSCEKEIFTSTGTYVGLYWNADVLKPAIFCSEFTRYRIRLDSISLTGKKKVVLNFEGTCVGISVGKNNSEAVYCLSGNIWKFNYSKQQRISYHNCIIKNDGKNSTPTLLENGDIIFCSDSKMLKKGYSASSGPQICRYRNDTKTTELITNDGYCVGPSYTPVTQKIAYSKKVNRVMQLFVYDCKNKTHQQVTFDEGNKIDCSWSACGNYLVFCYQLKGTSRVGAMHITLRERWYITPPGVQAYYPACSPVYRNFPVM